MKLYNTLTRTIEELEFIHPPYVGLYACGPTVYDYTHIGHLRKYVMDDVLVRTLQHQEYKVKHVMNITDVGHLTSDDDSGEDKLEKGAKKYQMAVWDLAEKFEKFFWHSLDTMNIQRPNVVEKVTDCIQEQIELVKILEEKGFTYRIEDGIYLDTSKLKDYGKLAKLDIENLKAGARVDVKGKRNITDFALWKFEREGENRQMSWSSPWSERGFPGWHIECSAISMKHLGDQIDIHTGGIDHIPVHHTNEIAQSEAATGKKPFVKYWVHHNFLQVEGQKMSKSLGNFYTIEDIERKGFSSQALRLLFLSTHYRSEMNFTWKSLEGAQKAWERLVRKITDCKLQITNKNAKIQISKHSYVQQFIGFMQNDLQTPEALAVFWQVVKDDKLSDVEKYQLLLEFDQVLGLGLNEAQGSQVVDHTLDIKDLPKNIQDLVAQREQARNNKDWKKSDKLRDEIQKQGYKVVDTEDGMEVMSGVPVLRPECIPVLRPESPVGRGAE